MPAELRPIYIVFAVLLGLLFGSFLSVCIYRIPRDLSVVRPRSFCPECRKQIRAADNVPILSFFLLRGQCRYCGHEFGIRYPLVEFTTAVLFGIVVLRYPDIGSAVKWALFESILVVLFWTDLEERILPDELTIGGTLAGLILASVIRVPGALIPLLVPDWPRAAQSLLNSIIGAALFSGMIWLIGKLYASLRKREGVGLGDVKLLLLLGAFLGVEGGLEAVLIGSVAGAIAGPIYVWARGKDARTYELPFGSFLCLGGSIVPLLSWFAKQ